MYIGFHDIAEILLKLALSANQSINVYGSIIIIIVVHHSFALRLNLNYTDYQYFLWTAQSVNTSSASHFPMINKNNFIEFK